MFTEKNTEESIAVSSSLAYWKQRLTDAPLLLPLPSDRPRPAKRTFRENSQSFVLHQELTTALSLLSRQEEVTLFITFLTAFNALLYRYTGVEDIVVGSPAVNSNYASAELIFINALVLRTDMSGNPSFQQLLERVRQVALSAQNYQDVPFSVLVAELQPEADPSYSPLFQVMFAFRENVSSQTIEFSSLAASLGATEDNKTKFDLTLFVEESSNGLTLRWLYNADLFNPGTIERMNGHFQTMLAGIVANPQQPISELPLLTAKEQQQLFVEWNNTQIDYPHDKCIHQLFEEQVVQNPEEVAVIFAGQHLTYRELNSRANQLAHYLKSLGVGNDVLVGICLERSLEMAVGFLGIFKAGGAYVPLDPGYPSARLAFMLADSQLLVILTQERLLEILPEHKAKVICLDTNWQEICQQSSENPVVEITSEHLAYVMYTSGSTGKPKGVMITHHGLVNHNLAIAKLFGLNARDRMLQSGSISFDLSVEEIFPTWITGGSLILRNEAALDSIRNLLQFVETEQITILDLPTALWHELVHGMREFGEKLPNCVRLVVVGGEKASGVAYLHWRNLVGNRCRWINTYGPTETTVSATFYEPAANPEQQFISEIPIGRPLANTQIYILDQQLQPVPIGVPGELYIGGAGVARGYLNRPELTAAKFIPNPFTDDGNAYLYKTGDQARYLPDGNIEFIGRIDAQVKIRGLRIELGEIEASLAKHPDIRETAVIVREDVPGDKRLVACIVPNQERTPIANDLRDFLSQNLPNYMLPSAFVTLDALPLTPSGKVDRRALLAYTAPNSFVSSATISQTVNSKIATTKALLPDPSIALPEPEQEPITKIFSNWAAQIPAHPAIIQAERTWTYGELAAAAQTIAQILQSHKVEIGDTVAVSGVRSFGLIASMLGVLMSGGVLLNIDPNLPQARQQLMLTTAKTKYLLYIGTRAPEPNLTVADVAIITINPETGKQIVPDFTSAAEYVPVHLSPDDAAYIFFTSGTTGTPKGVLGCHKGLSHFLNWQRQTFELTPQDQVAQLTGLSFDVVLRDIFLPLTSGATLCLPSIKDDLTPDSILPWIEQQRISLLHTVPTLAQSWLMDVPPGISLRALRRVFFAGEPLTAALIQRWRKAFPESGEIINLYGPTETTLAKCYYRVPTENILPGVQPVGFPLPQTQALVFTPNHQLCGIGEAGEIVIRTPFRSKGYINASVENLSKFVKNRFREEEQDLLYYTGDIGRYRPDGSLEILGRVDHQVKIRGVRIEPGEIGALLDKHPKILANVVIAREDVPGEKRLVAYCIPNKETAPTTSELREFLKPQLPDYMIPAAFVMLEALPLTPNGKIDRRALPAPNYSRQEPENTFVSPRNQLEIQLTKIWEKVLGVQRIGIRDNFFELGGHSLSAARMIGYCYQAFSIQLSLRELFASPTIAGLAEIIKQFQQQDTELSEYQSIPRRANRDSAPLSFAQQRLWFLEQLEPNRADYHSQLAVRLTGCLNLAALQQALNAIVTRHEALRTNFISKDGKPIQVIREPQTVELVRVDLQNCSATERDTQIQRRLQQERQRPFNLAQDLMLRACLLQIASQEYILLVVIHHIVFDGWSLTIFCQELNFLYTVFCKGLAPSLPELPIQYADFAEWQRQQLSGQELENQLKYWKQQLAGADPVLELPTDYSRPLVQTFSGASQSLVLNQSLTAFLKALSRQQETTLFMVLMAAFQLLLYRQSGQENFLVGSPFAGRSRTEVEGLIGFFAITIVFRANLSGNPSFRELLDRVREMVLGAYSHQDLPFEKLVEELQIKRDLSRNPLFQVWFNLLNFEDSKIDGSKMELQGLTVEPLLHQQVNSKFDLTFYLQEENQTIELELVYNSNLFIPERMAEMLKQFEHLLNQIVANPEAKISELSLMTSTATAILPNPQQPLLATWTGAVHTHFSQQAQRVPQQLAVVDAVVSWNYAELEERTNLLANYLLEQQIQSQDVVAIYAHRSAALVWAILGVLKAGAAFVILDPAYPTARLINYLEISQPRAFLQITAAGELPKSILETLESLSCRCRLELTANSIEEVRCQFQGYGNHNPGIQVEPDDLAYVAFTSGSTGKPKGILGQHRPLPHFLEWHRQTFGFNQSARFSLLSGLSHDPLLRDIFTPLTLGATLCIPRQEDIETPGRLAEWMVQQKVTASHITPPMAQLLAVNTTVTNIYQRYVFFGGDILTTQDVEKIRVFAPNATCVNFYGATETPQAMGYFIIPTPEEQIGLKETIPVGKGIADVQLLILNQQKQLAGIGELGEIYVRTPYLTKGYVGSEVLTNERFIINPFTNIPEDRLYKTGDLGRYFPNGDVEFLGRSDYQVKIRGFRIELAEIDSVLSQHPNVQENVVIAREDELGNKNLVAYIVTHPQQKLNKSELREFLQKQLPDYMVPVAFMVLEALPLTPNGKIDRRALPAPEYDRQESENTFIAPRNELEIQLTKIWSKVLGIQSISINDNFFELGGHSLLAVHLFAEIEKILGIKLSLGTLFQSQTIEMLATLIDQKESLAPSKSLVQIQVGNHTKPLLFCIHARWGNVLFYRKLARYLDPEQPFYALEAQGVDGKKAPRTSIPEMAMHYIQEIRMIQPEGPYFLGGFSFGGLVAFEIAQQLHAQGQEVALLSLFDTEPPNSIESNSGLIERQPKDLGKRIWLHTTTLFSLGFKRQLNYLWDRLQWHFTVGKASLFYRIYLHYIKRSPSEVRLIKVCAANHEARSNYIARIYPGKLVLIATTNRIEEFKNDPQLGWGELAAEGVEVHEVPGTHTTLMEEPNVRFLAEKLTHCLQIRATTASTR